MERRTFMQALLAAAAALLLPSSWRPGRLDEDWALGDEALEEVGADYYADADYPGPNMVVRQRYLTWDGEWTDWSEEAPL
jgi:hypothetical protein